MFFYLIHVNAKLKYPSKGEKAMAGIGPSSWAKKRVNTVKSWEWWMKD